MCNFKNFFEVHTHSVLKIKSNTDYLNYSLRNKIEKYYNLYAYELEINRTAGKHFQFQIINRCPIYTWAIFLLKTYRKTHSV